LAGKYGLNVDQTELPAIVLTFMIYILGQGVADIGKERAKIEKTVH